MNQKASVARLVNTGQFSPSDFLSAISFVWFAKKQKREGRKYQSSDDKHTVLKDELVNDNFLPFFQYAILLSVNISLKQIIRAIEGIIFRPALAQSNFKNKCYKLCIGEKQIYIFIYLSIYFLLHSSLSGLLQRQL